MRGLIALVVVLIIAGAGYFWVVNGGDTDAAVTEMQGAASDAVGDVYKR